jgi:DNA polymerase III epsilon subunit-like protein
MKQLKDRIHTMIQSMARPGPLFLVFHDNSQDLKYLRSPEVDAPLDGLSFILPETCAGAESSDTLKTFVIDTAELFAALEGDSGGQKRSLERMCRLLQVDASLTQHLHNAGNDAQVLLPHPLPRQPH